MRLNLNYTKYALDLHCVYKVYKRVSWNMIYEGWTNCSSGTLHNCCRTRDANWDASLSSLSVCLRKLYHRKKEKKTHQIRQFSQTLKILMLRLIFCTSEAHKQSRSLRGIMWMCVWNAKKKNELLIEAFSSGFKRNRKLGKSVCAYMKYNLPSCCAIVDQ